VRALGDAQWSGLYTEKGGRSSVLWLLACPPAFARIDPKPVPFLACNRRRFCPFCWAREAGNLWDRLDRKLFCGDRYPGAVRYTEDGRRLPPSCLPDHDLAMRTQTYTFPHVDSDPVARFLTGRITGRTSPNRRPSRRDKLARLRKAGALGILDNTRVQPTFQAQASGEEPVHAGWQLVVRQLLILPHAEDDVVLAHPAFAPVDAGPRIASAQTLRRYPRLTRKQFASQVARALAYPRHLLHGDINLTMTTLDMIQDRRLVSPAGLFRGQIETSESLED
jgi:hypothetical protein